MFDVLYSAVLICTWPPIMRAGFTFTERARIRFLYWLISEINNRTVVVREGETSNPILVNSIVNLSLPLTRDVDFKVVLSFVNVNIVLPAPSSNVSSYCGTPLGRRYAEFASRRSRSDDQRPSQEQSIEQISLYALHFLEHWEKIHSQILHSRCYDEI